MIERWSTFEHEESQYEASKRKQTRINGKFNLQRKKLTLYQSKQSVLASSISKTREELLLFIKSVFPASITQF